MSGLSQLHFYSRIMSLMTVYILGMHCNFSHQKWSAEICIFRFWTKIYGTQHHPDSVAIELNKNNILIFNINIFIVQSYCFTLNKSVVILLACICFKCSIIKIIQLN